MISIRNFKLSFANAHPQHMSQDAAGGKELVKLPGLSSPRPFPGSNAEPSVKNLTSVWQFAAQSLG